MWINGNNRLLIKKNSKIFFANNKKLKRVPRCNNLKKLNDKNKQVTPNTIHKYINNLIHKNLFDIKESFNFK